MVNRFLCLVAAFAFSLAVVPAGEAPWKTRRVVVIVVDGPRWSETWGDPRRENIPQQATRVAPQAVLNTSFRNDGKTSTNPGHTAICTGVYQAIVNDGSELPRHPGIFQAWLAGAQAPAEDAWIVSGKGKLDVLGNCVDPEWHGRFQCKRDCGNNGPGMRGLGSTMVRAQSLFLTAKPHLLLVSLHEPDVSGHAKNWAGYLAGIRETDALIGNFWQALRADAALARETTLFITNDHGRHLDGVKDGFVNHGCECDGCRHISLLAAGPDFRSGAVTDVARGQIDIAATIAELMGFALPACQGKVMWELFETPRLP